MAADVWTLCMAQMTSASVHRAGIALNHNADTPEAGRQPFGSYF
ncbi:hypothetical protein [Oceaniovalibus sp. ACAM 378]|nr:hypothetical protein [Oceaniovalibus sp. ACAM 378]